MSDTVQREHSGHIYVTHFKAHVASGEYWTSADIVDCIVSYTVTQLMDIMTDPNSREGVEMLARVCIMPAAFMLSQQQACHAAHARPAVTFRCIISSMVPRKFDVILWWLRVCMCVSPTH